MQNSTYSQPFVIDGTSSNDVLLGTKAGDWLFGNDGNDFVYASEGDDIAYGGTGDDILLGCDGNDLLIGQIGNDVLVGGTGNDYLSGELGKDILIGGAGADMFVFSKPIDAIDVIVDFSLFEGDKILVFALPFGASSQKEFSYENTTGSLTFNSIQFASLSPSLNITSSDIILL